jgi:hypothetical protein
MLGIDVNAPPLPREETRIEFIKRYGGGQRQAAGHSPRYTDDRWWEEPARFFDSRDRKPGS